MVCMYVSDRPAPRAHCDSVEAGNGFSKDMVDAAIVDFVASPVQ